MSSGLPVNEDIRCQCRLNTDQEELVQCEECQYWSHLKCVPVHDGPFRCEICLEHSVDVEVSEDSKKKATESPSRTKQKYNHIEEYINGSDTLELFKLFRSKLNVDRLQSRQPPLQKYTNFEFCDVVIVPSIQVLRQVLPKQYETKEIRGRGATSKSRHSRYGIFLKEALDPGVFIDCYLGHYHCMEHMLSKAPKLFQPCPQPFVLCPDIPNGLVIDARRSGNEMRCMRRSCRPNVTIKPIVVSSNQSVQIGVFAMNGLRQGEELFAPLDGLPLFKYECSCGQAEHCLGPADLLPPPKEPSVDFEAVPLLSKERNMKKLSREERKLQRYIEFFEKMDAIDGSKPTSHTSSASGSASTSASTSARRKPVGQGKPQVPQRPQSTSESPSSSTPPSPKLLKKHWMAAFKAPIVAAPEPTKAADISDDIVDVVSFNPPELVSYPSTSSLTQHPKSADDSRLTPLSQIISSEGTAVPSADGETPSRKRLSLNDYFEKRRKASSPPVVDPAAASGIAAGTGTPIRPQQQPQEKEQQDQEEEGQIVE